MQGCVDAADSHAGRAISSAALHRLLTGAIPSLLCRALSHAPTSAAEASDGGGRSPAGASSDSLIDHIRSILKDAADAETDPAADGEEGLARLASAEAELLVQRQVRCFEDLGQAEISFLAFRNTYTCAYEHIYMYVCRCAALKTSGRRRSASWPSGIHIHVHMSTYTCTCAGAPL